MDEGRRVPLIVSRRLDVLPRQPDKEGCWVIGRRAAEVSDQQGFRPNPFPRDHYRPKECAEETASRNLGHHQPSSRSRQIQSANRSKPLATLRRGHSVALESQDGCGGSRYGPP